MKTLLFLSLLLLAMVVIVGCTYPVYYVLESETDNSDEEEELYPLDDPKLEELKQYYTDLYGYRNSEGGGIGFDGEHMIYTITWFWHWPTADPLTHTLFYGNFRWEFDIGWYILYPDNIPFEYTFLEIPEFNDN